ncbi:hypothetical protein R1917_21265 [Citrobacter koseri]|uniref:hypothetical protein n=1 Tax=Citrobacter koseri TaxID=545 RepID=UPI002942FF6F|nr:hypothetical protein [Citrobacter koseri]MEB2704035.1 hypothetical protein [Citrobacter koseri]MEB2709584.1 hypothetical protein [Citrobacter koseri]WOJ30421.1 hypothetical protein R1917_21265 [Citrobacter koseri]WOJ34595.1 hypothetical protein R1243_18815 [Citrobacter koseri]
MNKDPLTTNVSDGLGKIHEADELIPEEKISEIAEKAKFEAQKPLAEKKKINIKR